MMIKTVIYRSHEWFDLIEQGWITLTIETHPVISEWQVVQMVRPDVRGTTSSYAKK